MTTETFLGHSLSFAVYGSPVPQGSKRAFGNRVVDVSPERLRGWREDVKQAALTAMELNPAWDRETAALLGSFTFALKRPHHHYVGGNPARELRESAPRLHSSRPDLDKLLRGVWDALTSAGAYRDDSCLAQTFATKVYVDPLGYEDMDRPGVLITLTAVRP